MTDATYHPTSRQVAAGMRQGAACAHPTLVLDVPDEHAAQLVVTGLRRQQEWSR